MVDIGALFGGGGTSLPTIPALATFKSLVKTENLEIQKYSKTAPVQKDLKYFQDKIGKVTSVDQLVKDPRLLKVLATAYGVEDDLNAPAKLKAVLTSDLSDTSSFANRLIDPRYKKFASAFDTKVNGMSRFKNAQVISDTVTKYVSNAYEKSLGDKNPALRAVTLSFKRLGQAPGDADADQLDTAADLADEFSAGEVRVTHDQNLLLPWVREQDLPALWVAASHAGLARSNIRLLSDMIACPGGDFCALANARSIPIAAAITERYQDLDELHDLGEIDLHISGCINSCGHHHSGHIGILGVDKDGKEWYQVSLGGSDGSKLSGAAVAGKVVGPSFSAGEVPGVVEAVLEVFRRERQGRETFIDALRRVGFEPFKAAANAARWPQAHDELHVLPKTPGFAKDAQEA